MARPDPILLRRLTANVIFFSAFVGLGILSFLGNRWLSAIFIVTVIVVVARHSVSICAHCSNLACGFNPGQKNRKAGDLLDDQGNCEGEFSNLPITRTTVIPFLITGPLAVIGAWLYSPIATIILLAIILIAHQVFTKLTCSYCGNNCVGNCNPRYKEWKAAQKGAAT
jgi:hypothetical protein